VHAEELVVHPAREFLGAFAIAAIDAFDQPVDREFFHLGYFFLAEYPLGHR